MNLVEYVLLAFTSFFVLGTPVLLYYRSKMTKARIKKHSNYSKRRILKITGINIFVHFLAFIGFLALYFFLVSSAKTFQPLSIVLTIIFFIIYALIFYGGGIYVASMVMEAYTIPELTRSEFFKTQLIAIKLFHHPISHVLVFSGGLFAMLTIVFLDLSLKSLHPTDITLLIFAGFLAGGFYAYSQIHNGTAIFHIPAGLICLILLLTSFRLTNTPFSQSITGSYFLPFLLTFNIVILVYILSLKKRNKKIIKPLVEIHPITAEAKK